MSALAPLMPIGPAILRVIEQAALAAVATDTPTALRLALLASELRRAGK